MSAPPPGSPLSPELERRLAIHLFNHAWRLLERADRSADDDDALLHAAHASRHHWGVIGGPVNRVRGEWQCSRVYTVLGRPEPALHHARRCLALCQAHPDELADFDEAFAHEALARAHALAGDAAAASEHRARAEALAAGVADQEDRDLLLADLRSLPGGS